MKISLKQNIFIILSLTVFGILVHDMHIDKIATAAIGAPLVAVSYGVSEMFAHKSEHTHVERASVGRQVMAQTQGSLPKVSPRDEHEKGYVQTGRLSLAGGGTSNSLWPSV